MLKTESLQCCIHRPDDGRGGVMGIQGGGAGGSQFLRRKQRLQSLPFGFPLFVPWIKDLRQASPPDVAHENRPLVGRHWSSRGFCRKEQFNRGEIIVALP